MSQIPDARFSRATRLVNGFQYTRVFQKNARSADRYWTVLSRSSADYPENSESSSSDKDFSATDCTSVRPARLGMAVAKKTAKRAVDRNRLKRLARESFRQHKHSLAGFDIVLLARHASVTASNQEILKSLEKHWSRIGNNA